MKNLKKKKEKQLDICLKEDVEMTVSNGFERYKFVHHALPEVDFSEIDTSTTFLGKKLKAPILISSMVGGTASASRINRNLAGVAQKMGVAMGVGSQRIALEQYSNITIKQSFQVRDVAPDILLFANLGATSLNYGFGAKEAKKAILMIKADGLILHLNPLQEALQNGGQTNFKGVLDKINHVVKFVRFPVIIKEVGCGTSHEVATKLYKAGVRIVDTAGAGGTSWAHIEALCASSLTPCVTSYKLPATTSPLVGRSGQVTSFKNWGIPTAESLVQCKKVKGLRVIASGGIRNGVEIAKAIALGADLVGIGLPLLKAARKGEKEVESLLKQLIFELKVAMFCVGATSIGELKKVSILKKDGLGSSNH